MNRKELGAPCFADVKIAKILLEKTVYYIHNYCSLQNILSQ
jgi:hypothetical protein